MKTATLTISLLFAGLYGSYILAIPLGINDPINIDMKLVTIVDGKAFFADYSVGRNWTEASKFCEDMGMNLADIRTPVEADALRLAYSDGFNSTYWTSARDAHQPRQFTWNTTGEQLSDTFNSLGGGWMNLTYQTCLFHWSKPNNESELYWLGCNRTTGVLCSAQSQKC